MKVMLFLLATLPLSAVAESPEVPQLVIPCEVVEVYDGDTVTVRLTLDVRVRLLDCWTPEVRTRDATEKQYGLHSKETLQELVSDERCLLVVPLSEMDRLDDLFTFGRLLARLKLVDSGLDASDEMVRMGAATEAKP